MDLCISGCGFLASYHIGIAACFKKYAPQLLENKISSSSAGTFVACSILCDLSLEVMTSTILRIRQEVQKYTFGPFNPFCNVREIIFKIFHQILPEDAHIRVNGRLYISLTRVCDGKNIIVSQFSSKDDLIEALMAATCVPFYSSLLPYSRFRDVLYIDGGLTNNCPTFDKNTIVISPFCGEIDICPRDISSRVFFHINFLDLKNIKMSIPNIYRFWGTLLPYKVEILLDLSEQGFHDALNFLHCNNLLKCTKCPVPSTFVIQKMIDDNMKYEPKCAECKLHIQRKLKISSQVLQKYI